MSGSKKLLPCEKRRITNAQKIEIDWTKACSEGVLRMISAHADAIGSPKHYIYFPLLTVIGSFMGVNASIKINPEWSEPSILWNVVMARKGEKKTAAMKRILSSVEVGPIK